ncbi:MAG TPA: tetratricopeptide repeat protein [Chloroflexia bacterium]|nr:tetratricopeptide repeat protein [Chloroflexia bacterium]
MKVCPNCAFENGDAAAYCQKCEQSFRGELKTTGQEVQALAYLKLTEATGYLRREEPALAIPLLREAVGLDQDNAVLHAYLGAALAEEYEVEEAESELKTALRLNDQDAIVQMKMAEFKLKLGLTLDAAQHLEIARKLPAPSRETANYIARLLQATRKKNRNIIERKTYNPAKALLKFLKKPAIRPQSKTGTMVNEL